MSRFHHLGVLLASLVFLPIVDSRVQAQPKNTGPVVPAGYPTLTTPANLGGAPGATVEHILTGTNLTNATAVAVSFPGSASIVEPPKEPGKLKVKFEIPTQTPIGLYYLRVATESGVSNLRPFVVDSIPIVTEKDGNSKKDTAQHVELPCVIVGAGNVEAGDYYKFKVTAGQTITFESLGRRIGSPIDPVLILYDAKGNEMPGLWADDTPGLQADARFRHTFPSAGEFVVEIRDTTYRGGADFAYRLRIGDFPAATCAFPLAVEHGKKSQIGFAGPGAERLATVSVAALKDSAVVYAIPPGEIPGWPVPVRVSDCPESVEQEPNNTASQANSLPVPGGVSARFGEKNDADFFKFRAAKGRKLAVQVLTYELNLQTEVYARILDGYGKELMKSNPQTAGVRLEFTPPADGDYFVACEQNNYAFGPNEVYHLSVKPVAPDFSVTLGLDRADIPRGGIGLIPITAVNRMNGFAGPIELTFGESKATIPTGVAPTPANPFWFPLTTGVDVKPGLILGSVKATAKIADKDVFHLASTLEIAKASLGGMPNPPLEFATAIGIATTSQGPFALNLAFDKSEVAKGGTLKGKITAKRRSGFEGEIALTALSLPANVTAKLNPIPKGKNEANAELTFASNASPGPATVLIRGVVKVKGKDSTAAAVLNINVKDAAKK